MLIHGGKFAIPLSFCLAWIVLAALPIGETPPVVAVMSLSSLLASAAATFLFCGCAVWLTATSAIVPEKNLGMAARAREVFVRDILVPLRGVKCSAVIRSAIIAGGAALVLSIALTIAAIDIGGFFGVELRPQPIAVTLESASGFRLAFMLFQVAVIAPLCEEHFFRYALEGTLRGATGRPRVAALVVAVLFAAAHFSAVAFPALIAVSLIFSRAYAKSRNMAVPVLAHSFFNLTSAVLTLCPNAD